MSLVILFLGAVQTSGAAVAPINCAQVSQVRYCSVRPATVPDTPEHLLALKQQQMAADAVAFAPLAKGITPDACAQARISASTTGRLSLVGAVNSLCKR